MSKILLQNTADISADMVNDVIDKWIVGRDADRNKAILKGYYISGKHVDGKSNNTLAEEFEMSPRRIRSIIHKYEYVIFKHLGLYS